MIGGRWTLGAFLGEGATAYVYEASDEGGNVAAVKLLKPGMAMQQQIRERFEREGRALVGLSHPGFVRVLDQSGPDASTPYLALERLKGETLEERVQRAPALSRTELLERIDQALSTLRLAHGHGIVHRDLKPANLWLDSEGGVKLLDFGLARLIDPEAECRLTHLGLVVGTITYMSPEQAQGKSRDADERADVYAVGAILFRILSGRLIHEAETPREIVAKTSSEPAPPFLSVVPDAPPALAALIDRCLAFDKEQRYPNAELLQKDVRALLQAETDATSALVLSEDDASSEEDTVAQELIGTVVADRYRVDKLLGKGSMGSVYKAWHVHMRKALAIKILHREFTHDSELVARFEREAVAAANIDHPNVARASDFGKLADGSYFLVLELALGRSLREELERAAPFSLPRALSIGRQIAEALAAAHRQGVIHRDLKPENVMLLSGSAGEPAKVDRVKILDFGIAKLTEAEPGRQELLTRMGYIYGTPQYMSPEQAIGESVDARADLYSLGVLLYEMLAGRCPFVSDNPAAALSQQLTQPPPALPDAVPVDVRRMIESLLAREAADRPTSAEELLTTLAHISRTDRPKAFLALSTRVRTNFDALRAKLQGRVEIRGRAIALGLIVGAAFAALSVVATLVVALRDDPVALEQAPAVVESAGQEAPVQPEVIDGDFDEERHERMEAVPVYKRTLEDWTALASGYMALEKYDRSANAYQAVLSLRPDYAKDRGLLADLRRAGEEFEAYKLVLVLAESSLGKDGVDLLYDLWLGTRADEEKAEIALAVKKKLEILRLRASSPLQIALTLTFSKKCETYAEALDQAKRYADKRALPLLDTLMKTEGCGDDGKRDCFPCLRGDGRLEQAHKAAARRPGPTFEW